MVAFFRRYPGRNKVTALTKSGKDGKELYSGYNAYSKSAFGIVHVRTDGPSRRTVVKKIKRRAIKSLLVRAVHRTSVTKDIDQASYRDPRGSGWVDHRH
jgi:hypothetical protein